MSTPKFTPGPWKAHLNYPAAAIPGHLVKADNDTESPVALIWEGGGTHGKPRMVANAHLIAAAPQMYEALLMVMDRAALDFSDAQIDQIEAALAKAEGRQA